MQRRHNFRIADHDPTMIGLMSSSRLESASIREIKTCPVCHSAGYDCVGETAKGFESNVGRDGGKHFEHPPYCILQCRSCDAYFKSHTLTSKELANYYAELDFKTFDYDGLLPTDRIVLNALRNLPIESRVLDFGCHWANWPIFKRSIRLLRSRG
jgi:hypothetical protein